MSEGKHGMAHRLLSFFFVLALSLTLFSCGGTSYHTARLYGMGTFCTFTLEGAPDEDGDASPELAVLLDLVEDTLSHRREDSAVAAINRGERVVVDNRLLSALLLSEEVKEKTQGLFSLSILPLTSLWNFDDESPTPPDADAIDTALLQTVKGTLIFENGTVWKKGGAIDLGAIGKGYACDVLADALRARGESGLISVGGSLAAVGGKGENAWQVGVRDPFSDVQSDLIGTLSLTDAAVSTSGSYEKTFTYEGEKYHHILDPYTGMPAVSDLVSVTVVAESGVLTDILSTACFLVGSERALSLAAEYEAAVLLVKSDGTLIANGAMKALFSPDGGREVVVP